MVTNIKNLTILTGHREWIPDECEQTNRHCLRSAGQGLQTTSWLQCHRIFTGWTVFVSNYCEYFTLSFGS